MKEYATWKRKKAVLWASVGIEFQKAILPFMQIIWPEMVETPNMGKLDRAGIHLLCVIDNRIEVVVQCKGFEVEELGYQQRVDAKESIVKFLDSGKRAEQYIFIHNRDSRNQQFNNVVEALLAKMIENGQVNHVGLWNLDRLPDILASHIETKIQRVLHKRAEESRLRHAGLFDFHFHVLKKIPVKESSLHFERGRPCQIKDQSCRTRFGLGDLVHNPSDCRLTLISGVFGMGKTTACLEVGTRVHEGGVVYVPCRMLHNEAVQSTNKLLETVLADLGVYEDEQAALVEYDSDRWIKSKRVFLELAGPVFRKILTRPQNGYLLIFDGLDENALFAKLPCVVAFINSIAQLECAILLTVRQEFIMPMFGNFELALKEYTVQNSPRKPGRVIQLLPWSRRDILNFLRGVELESEEERNRIEELIAHVEQGNDSYYGDCIFNPLFLSFIVIDSMKNRLRKVTRMELIEGWVYEKLYRDMKETRRAKVDEAKDANEILSTLMRLMEDVAGEMIKRDKELILLRDSTDEAQIQRKMRELGVNPTLGLMPVLLHTMFVPLQYSTMESRENLKVGFCLRLIQEFFLVRFLIRTNSSADDYPKSIRDLYRDSCR